MGTTPISVLANNTQARLEEVPGSTGAWWSRQFELLTGVVEAMNDLLLLVGRPTQIVNQPLTLVPNQCFQNVPKGVFLITDIQGAGSLLYKINLWDLDYLQSSWTSDWTQDIDSVARRWAPIGFNMFAVHPAAVVPQVVNVTAIQYPTTDAWPYSGSEAVVFQDEFFVALETYAAAYCRLKELGAEFSEGVKLMDEYMTMARRMTTIQDLRDPLIFSMSYGAASNVNPTTKR